jgi:transglutaminase/protease-like cytokinesis protein 3
MKKIFNLLTVAALLMAVLTNCNKDVAVTGVKLDETSLTLQVGETKTLIATVLPEKATNKLVTWISSDITVAIVTSGGQITALSSGETTIVVTTIDGNYTANCIVKVSGTSGNVSVTGVTLNKTTLPLEIDERETLIATVLPENATNKTVIWTTTDPLVATVTNGLVTAVGKGVAAIIVTTVDGNYTATCSVMIGYKLPALTTLPATEIWNNTATLSGNISDGGYPVYTERGICYSTTQNPTINDWKIVVSGSGLGNFTGEAANLSENTTYYVRAYATNTLGTAYGNQISFTTLPPSAFVRFEWRDDGMPISKMGVFNSDNVELASASSTSPYHNIVPGNHFPKYYINGPTGYTWNNILSGSGTYNFQVGRKYSIHCNWAYGGSFSFEITDDGPM